MKDGTAAGVGVILFVYNRLVVTTNVFVNTVVFVLETFDFFKMLNIGVDRFYYCMATYSVVSECGTVCSSSW